MAQGVCSLDFRNEATCACACVFPLPTLCQDCQAKHCLLPGFHFLLPLEKAPLITSQKHLLETQRHLFSLQTATRRLSNNIKELDNCKEQVEATYQEIVALSESLKSQYLCQLETLKSTLQSIIEKVKKEIMKYGADSAYEPSDPLMWMVWNCEARASDYLESFRFQSECIEEHLNRAFHVAYEISVPGTEKMNFSIIDEKITLKVCSSPHKETTLEMRSSDSVHTVKYRLQEAESIPMAYQELYYNEALLNSDSLLSDYKIKSNAFLTLKTSASINVTVTKDSASWEFCVGSREQVRNLKARISEREAIDVAAQQLLYGEVALEDDQCLQHYDISPNSVLSLVIRSERDMRVGVVWSKGNVLWLEVAKSMKVEQLIREVQKKTVWLLQTYLIYKSRILPKSSTLEDCGVTNNSLLRIYKHKGEKVRMCIATQENPELIIKYSTQLTVYQLKSLLFSYTALYPENLNLMVGETALNDSDTLQEVGGLEKLYLVVMEKRRGKKVVVKTLSGAEKELEVDEWDTMELVKARLEVEEGIPRNSQRIVSEGVNLQNRLTVRELPEDSKLEMRLEALSHIQVTFQLLGSGKFTKTVDEASVVSELKKMAAHYFDVPITSLQFFYGNTRLDDSRTLLSYGVGTASTIHIESRLR